MHFKLIIDKSCDRKAISLSNRNALVTFFIVVLTNIHSVLSYDVEELGGTSVLLGDGPHWRNPNLYYADLDGRKVVRYDTRINATYQCQIANATRVSFIIPYRHSSSSFAVGMGHVASKITWDGTSSTDCRVTEKLFEVETEQAQDISNCLNDGKSDRKGRIFTGTANCQGDFRELRRNLYSFDGNRLEVVQRRVNMSNGMTWNRAGDEFYYIDSGANTITRFKYNLNTGRAVSPEVVFVLNATEYRSRSNNFGWVLLDGMTIDRENNVFVTIFGGGVVLKISTRNWTVLNRYELPCAFVTSAVFGGPNLNELYVTSAATVLNLARFPPPCGSTFRITDVGARGRRMNEVAENDESSEETGRN